DRKRLALETADKDHKLMSRLSLLGSDVQLLPEDEGDLHAAKMMRLTYTKRAQNAVDIAALTVIAIRIMPDDSAEILKRVWDAKIPVCFSLAQEELVSEDHVPSPFYMLVPRISYFPLVIDRVIRYFIDFTEFAELKCKKTGSEENKQTEIGVEAVDHLRSSPKRLSAESQLTSVFDSLLPEHKVWLEYANQPLKWHYPIGLLFDLHADGTELPWKLVVHFNNYPTDVLLCPPVNRRAVELHFVSVIKEADVLKHRSQIMNQMQARDQRQLWTGLLTHQFDQFWAINQRLMQPIASNSEDVFSPSAGVDAVQSEQPSGASGDHCSGLMMSPSLSTESTFRQVRAFRNIPCRLYRASKFKGGACAGYIQKRVRPYASDGTPLTIGTVMRQFLSTEAAENDAEHPPTAKDEEYKLLLHGICLPEDAPIQWLSEHMAYADNFMHIVAWSSSRFNQALEL
ncbi:autophagy-related protein 5, partial [Paragonimus westermani]